MTGTGVKQLPDTQVNFSPFTEFISSNSRQYYIMLPSIPQNDADLITSRDEPPIRTQTCNPV